MAYRNKNNSLNAYVFAIIYPLGSLLYTLKQWRCTWAKNAFWIICTFLGFIQIFHPEGTELGDGSDSGRYVLNLMYMHDEVDSFSEMQDSFYDGSTLDIYCDSLTFLVSRFTDNGHVLFLTFAFVFGYFYSRNVWYILDRTPDKLRKWTWCLIALLFLTCPIWQVNGVRMWTAMHVFLYGALPFLIEGRKKRLLWVLLSILIHHSFIFPITFMAFYMLFKNSFFRKEKSLKYVFIFYLLSLTINQLNLSSLNSFLQSVLPSYYEERIDGYVSEETLSLRHDSTSGLSWHFYFFSTLKSWLVPIFVILSYSIMTKFRQSNKIIIPLFTFALLFSAFSNIAGCVPSGGRYIIIANFFMVSALILIYSWSPLTLSHTKIFNFLLPILGFTLIFDIRQGLDFYGIALALGNIFTAPFIDVDIPIITYIKNFIL